MKHLNVKQTVGFIAITVLLPALAMAYGGEGRGNGKRGPSQAAINACEGKNQGENVEFANRRGENISAACQERNGVLVAVPEGGRRGKGHRQ